MGIIYQKLEFNFKTYVILSKVVILMFLTVSIGAIFTPQIYPPLPTIGFIIIAGVVSLIGMTLWGIVIQQQYKTLPKNRKLEFKQKILPEAHYATIELFGYGSLVSLYNTFTSKNPTLCLLSLTMAGLFMLLVLIMWYFGYKSIK
jgi:hypothetical protein